MISGLPHGLEALINLIVLQKLLNIIPVSTHLPTPKKIIPGLYTRTGSKGYGPAPPTRDAFISLTKKQINSSFSTGGSSIFKALQKMVKEIFGAAIIHHSSTLTVRAKVIKYFNWAQRSVAYMRIRKEIFGWARRDMGCFCLTGKQEGIKVLQQRMDCPVIRS